MTDFALTLNSLSWVFYNRIFQVLVEWGIIYLPFAIYLYQNWYKQLERDVNTNIALLSIKSMLVSVIVFLFIYWLALLPTLELQKVRANYSVTTTPQSTTIQNNLNTLKNNLGVSELNSAGVPNAALKVPILWASVDIFTHLFNSTVIQKIPSSIGDVRAEIVNVIHDSNIKDLGIKDKYNFFYNKCYSSAIGKFNKMVESGQIKKQASSIWTFGIPYTTIGIEDYDWVGGKYFRDTKGFYKSCAITDSACYKDDVIVPLGIYIDEQRTISCNTAWAELRPLLISEFNINTSGRSGGQEAVNSNIRYKLQINNTRKFGDSVNYFSVDFWVGMIKEAFTLFGSWIVLFFTEITTTAVVAFLPMGQAITLGFFIILLPIAMLVSALRMDALVGFVMFYFTVSFLTVVWAIVNFMDNNLMYLVYGASNSSISQVAASVVSTFSLTGVLMSIATLFMYYYASSKWFQLMRMAGSEAAEEAGTSFSSAKETGDKVGSQTKSVASKAGKALKR